MDKNIDSKKRNKNKRKIENRGYMVTDMELGDDMNEIIYMYEEKTFPYKNSNIDEENKD